MHGLLLVFQDIEDPRTGTPRRIGTRKIRALRDRLGVEELADRFGLSRRQIGRISSR